MLFSEYVIVAAVFFVLTLIILAIATVKIDNFARNNDAFSMFLMALTVAAVWPVCLFASFFVVPYLAWSALIKYLLQRKRRK